MAHEAVSQPFKLLDQLIQKKYVERGEKDGSRIVLVIHKESICLK